MGQGVSDLSEDQIEEIAERAARRALEIVYAEVGRSVIKRLTWLVGVVTVGLALWLIGKDRLPL
jgi:hypothetical protein